MELYIKIPLVECIENWRLAVDGTLSVFEEMEQNNMSLSDILQAVSSSSTKLEAIERIEQLGLNSSTAQIALEIKLEDYLPDRRSVYKKDIESLKDYVASFME